MDPVLWLPTQPTAPLLQGCMSGQVPVWLSFAASCRLQESRDASLPQARLQLGNSLMAEWRALSFSGDLEPLAPSSSQSCQKHLPLHLSPRLSPLQESFLGGKPSLGLCYLVKQVSRPSLHLGRWALVGAQPLVCVLGDALRLQRPRQTVVDSVWPLAGNGTLCRSFLCS